MRSRRLAAGAVLTLAAFALSGCTVLNTLGSAADEARMSSALDDLEAELKMIPGITSVDADMPIRGDLKFDVSVIARSEGLSADSQRAAVDAVTVVLTSAPFSEQPQAKFALSDGEDETERTLVEIEFAGIDPAVVDAQLDYRDAFAIALGVPAGLWISPPQPDIGLDEYNRGITALDTPDDVDWAAIRGIPDDFDGARSWGIGAFVATGELIPENLEAFADEVVASEDYAFWDGPRDYLTVGVGSEKQADDFESLPAWSRLLDLLDLAQSSGAAVDSATASVGIGASAYFGECDDVRVEGIAEEFAAALNREGFDAKPGMCMLS